MERKPLDAFAVGCMVVLTALWGVQQVAIKLVAHDVSLLTQAAIRSAVATILLLGWARMRGIALFGRDGTLGAGLLAGVMFGLEFVFIYAGLAHTHASRMAVFIYLAPVVAVLGLHFLVAAERLGAVQWTGVVLAFAGIVLAFREGLGGAGDTRVGDLCGIAAGVAWGLTIIVMRTTGIARITATKALFYQHGVAALMLPVAAVALGEPGVVRLTPEAVASLAFQSVVVAFASFLAWFWLLTKYLVARLSVLACMTPLFGVLSGAALLGEPVGAAFVSGALLVAAGIVLVNLKRPG